MKHGLTALRLPLSALIAVAAVALDASSTDHRLDEGTLAFDIRLAIVRTVFDSSPSGSDIWISTGRGAVRAQASPQTPRPASTARALRPGRPTAHRIHVHRVPRPPRATPFQHGRRSGS